MNPYYKDFSEYMLEVFPGIKVQKLSIDAGFTCPNRDGSIGSGGCIYCNNASFTPGYCSPKDSVETQILKGKEFFRKKYPDMKYLAYFQSYTNTFGRKTDELLDMYRRAAEIEDVVGIIIGTRPDCLADDVLDGLAELNRQIPIIVEIGAETSFDGTLRLINRNHTWAHVENAVNMLHSRGMQVGLHLIAGLPGESADDVIETVRKSCALPIESIKMHQLQIVKGTPLLEKWNAGKIKVEPFTLEKYLELCVKIVKTVPRHICIERFLASSPPEMVVAPRWGLKNYQFTNLLMNQLRHTQ